VIFAVLDLRVAEVVLKRSFKLLSFFTIIIGKRRDPNCAICYEREDVEHFLLECPAQQLHHALRQYCRKHSRSYSVQSILTSEYCSDIIYDFIKSYGTLL